MSPKSVGSDLKSGWINLCNFLEEQATIAKKLLMDEFMLSALSGNEQEKKCSNCGKVHYCRCNKPKAAASVFVGSKSKTLSSLSKISSQI